eukprot:Cvel_16936.t2-p1 / transcript=Cvel_16936.t2 / gene=Cvel_16936 / organism=Chromera_velia_CCMP2878 / gene_product=hypothetical protein / transcript_product=hypothetical protein / location=Cvel_scaffold1328:2786-5051(+) / protein_length=188 / sequence_SO=supercontig / SO=protein_coding / is_pseudo=false
MWQVIDISSDLSWFNPALYSRYREFLKTGGERRGRPEKAVTMKSMRPPREMSSNQFAHAKILFEKFNYAKGTNTSVFLYPRTEKLERGELAETLRELKLDKEGLLMNSFENFCLLAFEHVASDPDGLVSSSERKWPHGSCSRTVLRKLFEKLGGGQSDVRTAFDNPTVCMNDVVGDEYESVTAFLAPL